MLLIRPLKTGYLASTPYGEVVLESHDHQALFDFVEADLASFQQAFTAFFASRINKATGAVIGEGISSTLADELRTRAREVHPLLANDSYLDSLSTMLLDYLNADLIHQGIDLTRKQYLKAATHLTDPIFYSGIARGRVHPRHQLLEAHYNIYEGRDLKALIGGPLHLVRLQKQLRLWLYWILDASASRLLQTHHRRALPTLPPGIQHERLLKRPHFLPNAFHGANLSAKFSRSRPTSSDPRIFSAGNNRPRKTRAMHRPSRSWVMILSNWMRI